MQTVEIDPQNLAIAETKIPSDASVTMINLVQFFEHAQYENAEQGVCSGKEAYMQRYAPAFQEVAAKLKIEPIELIYVGAVAHTILGPGEPKWDAIAVVRYPNFSALRKVIESPLYLEKAEPHRKAALKAWEFIATFQPEAG